MPGSSVRIRMYRQGLGDCFLLTLPGTKRPVHVLIDCGVYQQTPNAANLMRDVVENIARVTGGRLDAIVATHQHWDHLSGFRQAAGLFDKLTVGEVWLAWTEQPGNRRAQELKEELGVQLQAATAAMRRWQAAGIQPHLFTTVSQVVSFFGDVLSAGGATTQQVLDRLATMGGDQPRYLTPGQKPFGVPGAEGVRVFVLGPPTESSFLRRMDPREGSEDAYGLALTQARAFLAAAAGTDDDAALQQWRRQAFPFDEYSMVSSREAESRSDGFFARYFAEDWRRIDNDWLTVAGQLALDLDARTNNTSLVLAFEIVATGDVLLFPGDAQIGNWQSWGQLTFAVGASDGRSATVTGHDLLQRTVFYKVGHHGSHNATPRAEGLELMTSPELVAMIPVSRAMATQKKWRMPFEPLARRLTEKCRGRVIIADQPIDAAVKAAAGSLSKAELERFTCRTGGTETYLDYELPV